MKQSRLASLIESWGNTLLGFIGSILIQYAVCWTYDLPLKALDNLAIIGAFTVWSLVRNYGWRRFMEAIHIRIPLSAAMIAVVAERRRQHEIEGWSIEHDDKHELGELARAGTAYMLSGTGMGFAGKKLWPWEKSWFKPDPTRPRRDLVRGLALGLAELEKHDRTRKGK